MKLNLLVVVVLFAALPVLGQTAKVIPLTQKDATEAKELYAQQKDIEGKIVNLEWQPKLEMLKELCDEICWYRYPGQSKR